jgi:hypothetical protein
LEEIDKSNRSKGEMIVGDLISNIAGQYKLDDKPILPQFAGAEQIQRKKSVLSKSLGDNCNALRMKMTFL